MERIYENRRIVFRMRLVIVLLGAVAALSLWVLLGPALEPPTEKAGDPLFLGTVLMVIAVLGAFRFGQYGMKTVTALDLDRATGAIRLHLWRPLEDEVISSRAGALTDWAYEVGRRNTRMPIWRLRARLAGRSRRVIFELSPLAPIDPEFRRLAPKAIAEYEQDTGIAALAAAKA